MEGKKSSKKSKAAKRRTISSEPSYPPPKVGAPTIYTPELAAEICRRISSGRTTRSVSKDEDMPDLKTIYDWRDSGEHPEFLQSYMQARELLYQYWADEVVDDALNEGRDQMPRKTTTSGYDAKRGHYHETSETVVSDNTSVQRDRLKVDAKKWLLSKLRPQQYGEVVTQKHTGPNGEAVVPVLNINIVKKDDGSFGNA